MMTVRDYDIGDVVLMKPHPKGWDNRAGRYTVVGRIGVSQDYYLVGGIHKTTPNKGEWTVISNAIRLDPWVSRSD